MPQSSVRWFRPIAAVTILCLAAFGLTGCSDTDDDCQDDALALAAVSAPHKPGPGGARGGARRSGKSKSKPGKHGSHKGVHIDIDSCEDED